MSAPYDNGGRLVIYVPRHHRFSLPRLRTIASAAKRAALDLGVDIEGAFGRNVLSIAVYYEDPWGENWVYSDWDSGFEEDEIYRMICDLSMSLNASHRQQIG